MAAPPPLLPAAQEPLDYTWVVVVLAFFAVLLVGVITMAMLAERSRRRATQSGGRIAGRPGGRAPGRSGGGSSQDGAG